MSYIYQITNTINGKSYVGKTGSSPEKRFKQHINDSQKRDKEQRPLYAAIKKYGAESFKLQTLEECSMQEASEREKYWIEKLGTFKNGYNATIGGDGRAYADYDLIYSLYLNGETIDNIHNLTSYNINTIRRVLEDNQIYEKERIKRGHEHRQKPVAKLDKNTLETLEVFSSLKEVKESLNIQSASHISKVCKGTRQTAYGFKWKYL